MKSYYSIACCAICVAALVGCQGHRGTDREMSLSLQEQAPCLIPLDSLTSQETDYLQLVSDSVLAFFNRPTYHICFYNFNSGRTDKIKIYQEGPNALNGIDAFCYVSPDSIWLYESWGNVITRIDSIGEIKEKHELSTYKNSAGDNLRYAVTPLASASAPYVVKNGMHILMGANGTPSEGQIPGVTMIYDENMSDWRTGNPYPAIYGKPEDIMDWDFNYRCASFTMSPDNKIVINFAAADSLYVYDPETEKTEAYYAGFSEPTNIRRRSNQQSYESLLREGIERHYYIVIRYDKYKELYYRIILLPKTDYDDKDLQNELGKKPSAVIILDKDFNKVGESLLPEDHFYEGVSFVNQNGLNIRAESDDDDFMKFRVFKAVK